MPIKPFDQLGELQRTVLEVIWDEGEATVQDVVDLLAATRPLAYTTILTTLEKAGWVRHSARGRAFVYRPTRSRDRAGATSLRSFIDRVFAGDASLLFQALIDDRRLDDAELKRLRAMIDAKRRGGATPDTSGDRPRSGGLA
jgi:predicted transcriptional regulator